MGPLHPLEFFAESVINPSAIASKQHRGPAGKSTMPDYNEKMTVQELIDLSTYLASLKPKGGPEIGDWRWKNHSRSFRQRTDHY